MSPSVRKRVPPSAFSSLPILLWVGSGEGSLHVAEKLAFDQFIGNGGAIDFNQRCRVAQALMMQRCASSCRRAFAKMSTRPLVGAAMANLLTQRFHGNASADDPVTGPQFRASSCGSRPVNACGRARVLTTSSVFSIDSGFSTKIERHPKRVAFDGRLDSAMTRNHDDF